MKKDSKKKLIIDKYTQPIFIPNNVYVCKNYTKKDITNNFKYTDESEIDIDEGCDALTYYHVKDKDGKMCILILLDEFLFKNKEKYYTIGVCAHEAVHGVHRILEYCGIYLNKDNSEVYAYFIEWITKCIYTTANK